MLYKLTCQYNFITLYVLYTYSKPSEVNVFIII